MRKRKEAFIEELRSYINVKHLSSHLGEKRFYYIIYHSMASNEEEWKAGFHGQLQWVMSSGVGNSIYSLISTFMNGVLRKNEDEEKKREALHVCHQASDGCGYNAVQKQYLYLRLTTGHPHNASCNCFLYTFKVKND